MRKSHANRILRTYYTRCSKCNLAIRKPATRCDVCAWKSFGIPGPWTPYNVFAGATIRHH